MAYQQPQAPMNPAQQIPGVPNPEHSRLWQQFQDRHRAMGGADGMGQQQLNPQQVCIQRPLHIFAFAAPTDYVPSGLP